MKNDAGGFVLRLNDERPRSRIILASSYIEELIRQGVLACLNRNKAAEALFGEDGRMNASQTRQFAEALGLISCEEANAVKTLAQVRNRFSHDWRADFTGLDIQRICERFGIINIRHSSEMDSHQVAFAKADYIGISLVEVLGNRFVWARESSPYSSMRIKHILVDPESNQRTVEWK
ncbi:hypothetical protein SAMN05444004_11411 [Jannaschia faecimaris]|uniref:DUF4145 domain-containing protein n=1 Tax=Jannaschia faecimaris TaxID=1244108 RepID=A0A1H3SX57_9RHOB|nr:hypothetical protein [Jannaschia faecimaris]SDZ42218.1 hypothetical protein SAMN05444004_11411 [Jannaschia faecimaris]